MADLTMPSHFREGDQTPEAIHDRLKERMTDSDYARVYTDAMESAKRTHSAIMDHIKKTHDMDNYEVHDVHWTSQKGDVQRVTGNEEDTNNPSDLMVTLRHKKTGALHHVGLTLKYGNSKDTNDGNRGMESLAKDAGISPSVLSDHMKGTAALVKKYNITSHTDFKTYRDSDDPERKKIANEIKKQSISDRKKVAQSLSNGMSKLNDNELREHIRKISAPKTKTDLLKVHGLTSGTTTEHNISDPNEAVNHHLGKYSDLHVAEHNGDNLEVKIMGKNNETGKIEKVAGYNIHHGGRPTQGSNVGIFKLYKKKSRNKG